MTWVLIAAGLMVGLAVAVFGLALCVTAARADRAFDRERERLEANPHLHVVDELHKRPGDATTSRGMTEDR